MQKLSEFIPSLFHHSYISVCPLGNVSLGADVVSENIHLASRVLYPWHTHMECIVTLHSVAVRL